MLTIVWCVDAGRQGQIYPNLRTSGTLRIFLNGFNTSWPWENQSTLALLSKASALFERASRLSNSWRPGALSPPLLLLFVIGLIVLAAPLFTRICLLMCSRFAKRLSLLCRISCARPTYRRLQDPTLPTRSHSRSRRHPLRKPAHAPPCPFSRPLGHNPTSSTVFSPL